MCVTWSWRAGIKNGATNTMRASLSLLSCIIGLVALAQQTINGSYMHDGLLRDYRLYIPALYSAGTPVPLVFNLHGYTSDNLQQEFYGDFRPIADTANFIIVHPNGTMDGSGDRFWNAFGASTVDDLGFLTSLIDTISVHYSIDPDRVFSTGMSNGGFMSHELACYANERFAAIASVAGTMLYGHMAGCTTVHPTPVMQIHGTADGTVNYNSGSGLMGVEEMMASWALIDACNIIATITPLPDTDPTDGCTVEHWVHADGDAGSTVELFKVLGGGHTWPGALIDIGVTNHDIHASSEIWRFFNRYDLGTLTAISDASDPPSFTLGPNPTTDAFQLRFEDVRPRIVTVENTLGQMIVQHNTNASAFELRLADQGFYVITVRQAGTTSTKRVVKL